MEHFVAEHMDDVDKRRYEAGLMADAEIIAAIEDDVFKPLDEPFNRYTKPSAADVIVYVEAQLNKEVYSQAVSYNERPLSAVSNAEFLSMEHIRKSLPGAEVIPIEHFGYCDDYRGTYNPELAVNGCRVTLRYGVLELSRNYLL